MKSRTLLELSLILVVIVICSGCVKEKQTLIDKERPEGRGPPLGKGNASTAQPMAETDTVPLSSANTDPAFQIDVYKPEQVWSGTTLFADMHDKEKPRIIEVNMLGEVVWEYALPEDLKEYIDPGFDVEFLPDSDTILFVLPRKGVYEIDRDKNIVWSYLDPKVTHDADRLPNDNTIMVYGGFDTAEDAQVKEVDQSGNIVWSWYAKDHFYKSPYKEISNEGWTHTNAVTRMENGNTLISPRNFNFMIEVDSSGNVVKTIGEGIVSGQHDPEVLDNGNILVVTHGDPNEALELDSETGQIVWRYTVSHKKNWPVRDADRLPNGNTLITGSISIIEVNAKGEVVWRLAIKDVTFEKGEGGKRLFYKAERISG